LEFFLYQLAKVIVKMLDAKELNRLLLSDKAVATPLLIGRHTRHNNGGRAPTKKCVMVSSGLAKGAK